MHVSQIIILFTLNLFSAIYQLYSNTTGRKINISEILQRKKYLLGKANLLSKGSAFSNSKLTILSQRFKQAPNLSSLSTVRILFYYVTSFQRMNPYVFAAAAAAAAAAAKSLQSCPTLCDPTDGSPPGSSIPGILQARTLEWVAISFSNA